MSDSDNRVLPKCFFLPRPNEEAISNVRYGVGDVLSFESIPTDELNRVFVTVAKNAGTAQNVTFIIVDPWKQDIDSSTDELAHNYVSKDTKCVQKARALALSKGHSIESRRSLSRPETPIDLSGFPINTGVRASALDDERRSEAEDIMSEIENGKKAIQQIQELYEKWSQTDATTKEGEAQRDDLASRINEIIDSHVKSKEADESTIPTRVKRYLGAITQHLQSEGFAVRYRTIFGETLDTLTLDKIGVVFDASDTSEARQLAGYANEYLDEAKAFIEEYAAVLGPEYGRSFLDAMRSPSRHAMILVYNTESLKSWRNWILGSNGIRDQDKERKAAQAHMFTVEENRRETASKATESDGRFDDEERHPQRLVIPFIMPTHTLCDFLVNVSTMRFAAVQPAACADPSDAENKADKENQ